MKSRRAKQISKIIGVVLVVAFFASFYCWSYMDVAGNMSKVPVGIINKDAGTTLGDDAVNMGDALVDALADNAAATWQVLDEHALENGVEESGYLLVFEIPEDFSQNVAAGKSGPPKAADLIVYRDVRYNYIFSQLSTQVVKAFEDALADRIVSNYVSGAYEGLHSARDGMQSAADGAGQLNDGLQDLDTGLTEASNAAGDAANGADRLAGGAASVAEGSKTLDAGAQQLAQGTDGLAVGAQDLASGNAQLAAGTDQLSKSTQALPQQTQQLAEGINSAQSGLARAGGAAETMQQAASGITAGLDDLSTQMENGEDSLLELSAQLSHGAIGAQRLEAGANGAAQYYHAAIAAAQSGGIYQGKTTEEWQALADQASAQVATGAGQMSTQLSQASGATETAATNLGAARSAVGTSESEDRSLASASRQIRDGLGQLSGELTGSSEAMGMLSAGAGQLASGSRELAGSTARLNDASQQLSQGAGALADGAESAAAGTRGLLAGTGELSAGAESVSAGAGQLAQGMPQLQAGLNSATDGAGALADGAATLDDSLTDGAATLGENLGASSEEMGEYAASPLKTQQESFGALDGYGQGFAPFFMTTALWLGALLLFFVVDPMYPRRARAGRIRTVIGRLPLYLLICALEAVAVVGAAALIGVTSAYDVNFLVLYAFAFAVSCAFMLIMQFLTLTFGIVGRGIAVVVLILQLAAAGGTLPVELGRSELAAIKPWLPFTYSIDGFREAISLGRGAVIGKDALILLGVGLICLALSLLCWRIALLRQKSDNAEYAAYHLDDGAAPHDAFVAGEASGDEAVQKATTEQLAVLDSTAGK